MAERVMADMIVSFRAVNVISYIEEKRLMRINCTDCPRKSAIDADMATIDGRVAFKFFPFVDLTSSGKGSRNCT